MQSPNEAVSDALSKAYSKGSMLAGVTEEHGLARRYAEDFLSFVKQSLRSDRFGGTKVLEIGCGTGYFLYRMKLLGADVLGIEPGVHGQEGSKRFQVPIIKDIFPSEQITGKFDLVVLHNVLEHIQSPSEFISFIPAQLNENGRISVAVPDCDPHILVGDVSMLFHEHMNYYTTTSLRNSLLSAGLNADIEKSSFGGALYAITKSPTSTPIRGESQTGPEVQRLFGYARRAKEAVMRSLRCFEVANEKGESMGIYAPGRAINALSMMRSRVDLSKVRFFDDDEALHKKYFPGFDIPVESRDALIRKPTNQVLIMSRSFGKRIAHELRSSMDKRLMITMWEDLFMS